MTIVRTRDGRKLSGECGKLILFWHLTLLSIKREPDRSDGGAFAGGGEMLPERSGGLP
jgi:hypothetical protein